MLLDEHQDLLPQIGLRACSLSSPALRRLKLERLTCATAQMRLNE